MINDKDLGELHIWSLARVGNLETRRQIKELIDEVKELRAKVNPQTTAPNESADWVDIKDDNKIIFTGEGSKIS